LGGGCTVGYRYTDGPALNSQQHGGTTHTLHFEDRGGPLTKFSGAVLQTLTAAMVASSAYQYTETSRSMSREGDYIVTRTTGVTTYDHSKTVEAQKIMEQDWGGDPTSREDKESVYSSLDLSLRTIGGDTSGFLWQYGVDSGLMKVNMPLVKSIRLKAGLGWGSHKFYGRTGVDSENKATFLGTPLRIEFAHNRFLRTFVQYDSNCLGWFYDSGDENPSPLSFGPKIKNRKVNFFLKKKNLN